MYFFVIKFSEIVFNLIKESIVKNILTSEMMIMLVSYTEITDGLINLL